MSIFLDCMPLNISPPEKSVVLKKKGTVFFSHKKNVPFDLHEIKIDVYVSFHMLVLILVPDKKPPPTIAIKIARS